MLKILFKISTKFHFEIIVVFKLSKVYLEKTTMLAKQFNLKFILIQNYILCAKLYQELALPKTNSRIKYVKQALKIFQIAKIY